MLGCSSPCFCSCDWFCARTLCGIRNDNDSNDDNEMEYDINVMNISNLPHPARDKNAKWKLQDIFVESLGV